MKVGSGLVEGVLRFQADAGILSLAFTACMRAKTCASAVEPLCLCEIFWAYRSLLCYSPGEGVTLADVVYSLPCLFWVWLGYTTIAIFHALPPFPPL